MGICLLTVATAGTLGGALAVDLTALVVAAAIVLVLLAAANGLRMIGSVWGDAARD